MSQPTILVATWTGGLLACSGGKRSVEITDQPVRGLAPDGKGGVLAIVGQHELRRRDPGGEWTTVATSDLELSCCLAAGLSIYVGTENARLLRLPRNAATFEPVEAFDRVPGRAAWYAGSAIVNGRRMGPPLGVRSLTANADATVLCVNVHVGGIPRSEDGGQTWEPTIDINADVHEVRAHPADPNLIVAASSIGLCISRDAGATWAIESAGLHDPHCYAVAFSGADIIVSSSSDFFGGEGRLYRRPSAPSGSITPIEGATEGQLRSFVDTHCIATSGPAIAIADRSGNLYASPDHGKTWILSAAGLPVPSAVLIVPSHSVG